MSSVYLRVAEQVLRRENRPLTAREIIAIAEQHQLLPDSFAGKTPHQTLKSKLSVDIRKRDTGSMFVRTKPGRFALRRRTSERDVYVAPPLTPPKTQERVVVFPSSVLETLKRFDGVKPAWRRYLSALLRHGTETMDRYVAESDDEHKQIITYVLVTRGNQILAYRRGAFNRVEHFLRGSDCVGFGGHVTSADQNLLGQDDQGITQCAIRELSEELSLPREDLRRLDAGEGLSIVGLLNDDSSPVGRRHFAIVMKYEVSGDPSWDTPSRGEKAITRLRWLTPGDRLELNDFEYWSQLCLLHYYRDIVRGQPGVRIRRVTPFRPPHILCIVGQIGSGKTEVSEILQQEFGYSAVNSGAVLAGLLRRPPVVEDKRASFQAEALRFISRPTGPALLAAAIAQAAAASGSPRVVVDGLRQRATLDALRRTGGRIATLYVHTPPNVALLFYRARSGEDYTMTQFARVREAAVESEVPRFLEVADATLFNWHGRADYRRVVRDFVAETAIGARANAGSQNPPSP